MGIATAIQLLSAAGSGFKAIATLKKPPPGTKTVTFNTGMIVALLAWLAARLNFDISPGTLDVIAGFIITGLNLVLRKVTNGPLPGK